MQLHDSDNASGKIIPLNNGRRVQAPSEAPPFRTYFRLMIWLPALLLLYGPLCASSIGVSGDNYGVSISTIYSGSPCGGTDNAYGSFGVVYSASCSFTAAMGGNFSATAEAYTPKFGVAEAYASLSATGTSGLEEVFVNGTAWAYDTWTNTSSVPVNVSYINTVDIPPGGGLSSTTSPLDAAVALGVTADCLPSGSRAPVGIPTCTGAFSIAPGGSAIFYLGITTTVSADFFHYGWQDFSAVSDYLGSATLTSVTVTNANNGGSMPASVLESSNGTFLTSGGYASTSTVPEPGSLALVGAAFGVGAAIAMKRKLFASRYGS